MHLKSVLPLAVAACTSAASTDSLATVLAANNGTLSTLNSLLATVPQLTQMLSTAQNITILAPSNDAFTKLLQQMPSAAQMANNTVLVTALLQYHVVSGTVMSSGFSGTPMFAPTMLMNPFANVTGGQKVELLKENNMAMIFSGFKQMSTVTQADITFSGGVLHIVDTVLTIPATPAATAVDMGLTSLAGALVEANLVSGVDALTDATIFAPSNAAFEAIGSAAEALSPQDLGSVLEYHVLMNQVRFSTNLASASEMSLVTLAGQNITVRFEDGQLFVNSAKVIVADIITANGVVHVIDNVLNPSSTTATPNPSQATQSPAFAGASSVAQAPFTSGINPTTTLVPATMTGSVVGSANAAAAGAAPTAALLGLLGGAAAAWANL